MNFNLCLQLIMELREKLAVGLQKDGNLYTFDVSIPLNHFYEGVHLVREFLKNNKEALSISGFGHLGEILYSPLTSYIDIFNGVSFSGDGNLHLNVTSSTFNPDFYLHLEKFVFKWVASRRGSISAEHGVGFFKPEFLNYSKTAIEIESMKRIKSLMDPNSILNPLKVLP